MRYFLVFLLFLAFSLNSQAQRWKQYRYEVFGALGATGFLGDLGGADQIGTHFFRDLEWSQTRVAVKFGGRYKINEFLAARFNFDYGKVAGHDNTTKEFFRSYRNLSFKSNLYEFTGNMEASFMKEQVGHRYRLRGIRGQRGFEMYTYGFLGFGIFYFNPKTFYEGQWIALQPMGTEGQGLVSTRKKYSRLQMCIPVGFGFKYAIDRRWGIGIEYGIRYTFTDYIDDVSTTYYDNNLLLAERGPVAAAVADRSDFDAPQGSKSRPYITRGGEQRGDPRYTDSYMFAFLSLNYKLRTGRDNLPKF